MPISAADSRDFYQSPKGLKIRDLLRLRLGHMWPDVPGRRILPLGCADALFNTKDFVSGRMTAEQGENFSCLVDAQDKPLPDADIDGIVALHAVPGAADLALLLHEAWRVLKGEGHLLLVVPRRGSAWACDPASPFSLEEAYSLPQIKNALKQQGFFVVRTRRALFAPPRCSDALFSFLCRIERSMPCLFGGGVFLIDAQKRIAGLAGSKKAARKAAENPPLPLPLPI